MFLTISLQARLDHGSDEKLAQLKIQLQEMHQELEEAREELDKKTELLKASKEEVIIDNSFDYVVS